MNKKEIIPSFMVDDSEGDTKAEIVMDFVLSWSLRCANDKYKETKPILNDYCRYMLLNLIGLKNNNSISIKDVRVWKEWRNIDLTVEIDLVKDGKSYKYAILIENKYYSKLHDATDIDGVRRNQLIVYKNIFNTHYGDDWEKRYCLIACYSSKEEMDNTYGDVKKMYGFIAFPFYDMLDPTKYEKDGWIQTESDIFNEFWLNW